MDAELAEWIRTRPPQVQELVRRFPPNCLVRAVEGRTLMVPGPGQLAMVVSYHDDGTLGVVAMGTEQPAVANCQPEWLEVVRYDDVTPEDVEAALASEPV